MQNQNSNNTPSRSLELTVITPGENPVTVLCDTVNLMIAESKKGNDGGRYGIKYGHAPAVFALSKGKITAKLSGETVFEAEGDGGFARTDGKTVTVIEEIKN